MKTFSFTVTATFSTTIEVEAEDMAEAMHLAQQESFDAVLDVDPSHYNIELHSDN